MPGSGGDGQAAHGGGGGAGHLQQALHQDNEPSRWLDLMHCCC